MPAGRALADQFHLAVLVNRFQTHGKAPQPVQMLEHFLSAFSMQRATVIARMAQGQRAVLAVSNVPDLDIRFTAAEVVLVGQSQTQAPITGIIMNGGDFQLVLSVFYDFLYQI